MIYTVTFNPSLDYVIKVDQFTLGKLHRTKEEELIPGGKGINVSIVLGRLGLKSTALGFVAGFTGTELDSNLNRMGVVTDFIHAKKGFTRINVKLKTPDDTETELNGSGPVIEEEDIDALFSKLDGLSSKDYLILSGSVPQNMKRRETVYSELCRYIEQKNVRLVIDAEGDLLKNTLKFKPFLIKPNHLELANLFQRELKSIEDIIDCAKKLQEMGAQNVLISMAGEGAILLDQYGSSRHELAPKGQVLNSVGAGDSMIAGFLAGLIKGQVQNKETLFTSDDYINALKLGVSAGSAAAFSIALPEKEAIEEIFKNIH